jgi:beta-glucanase (GH16 family)
VAFATVVISLFAGLVAWYSGAGSAAPAQRTVVNLAARSTWHYFDRGTAPSGWNRPGFADRSWRAGRAQLGFGDGDEATRLGGRQVTTYFRTTFHADVALTSATMWLLVDDGAVAYVNGAEVARDNMPSGRIGATTKARANRTGRAESAVHTFSVPTRVLHAGTNTLAVEVHQNWTRSSDLSFDAGFTTTVPTTATTTAPTTTTAPPTTVTTTTTAPRPTTTVPAPATTTPTTTTTAAPRGGSATWSEDFDGPLDTSMWKPYYNTYGDGNHELACLTPANVTTTGGALTITSRQQPTTCPGGVTRAYSSGFVGTRETGHYFPMYGRFEMRARLPHGQGIWPAFWLRHRNGASTAEVDIMEYFHSAVPGQTTATLHLDGRRNLSKQSRFFETPTASPGWHTWAVDIEPDPAGVRFTFSLDGVAYHSYVDTQHHWADGVDPRATWDIALNVAVGGDWLGDPAGTLGYLPNLNRCAQGGTPPAGCRTDGILRAQFPATYQVDWVRYTAP